MVENEKCTLQELEYGKKSEKRGNRDTNTVGCKICCGVCQKKKTLKIMENEKNTQQDLEYGEKHGNTWKMRHKHCMTWKMVRNTEEGGK